MTASSPSRESVEEIVRGYFCTGPLSGSVARLTAALTDYMAALPEPPDIAGPPNVPGEEHAAAMQMMQAALTGMTARAEAAEAQVARLTEALREIGESFEEDAGASFSGPANAAFWRNMAEVQRDIARAALNPNPASDGEAG
jgi:hypothetical protein